jgi:hypothetical protein
VAPSESRSKVAHKQHRLIFLLSSAHQIQRRSRPRDGRYFRHHSGRSKHHPDRKYVQPVRVDPIPPCVFEHAVSPAYFLIISPRRTDVLVQAVHLPGFRLLTHSLCVDLFPRLRWPVQPRRIARHGSGRGAHPASGLSSGRGPNSRRHDCESALNYPTIPATSTPCVPLLAPSIEPEL